MLTAGRIRRSLDCAGPGHRRGRDNPRVGEIPWIVIRAEVVEEDDSCAHDRDKDGYQREYSSLSVHLPVSQICGITQVKPGA
jgi:hypothetical protein